MAVPKKRTSKARRDKRRAQHDRIAAPGLVRCPNCDEWHMPHRICPSCGYYGDRRIEEIESEG
ncbi:MAG: 50S ribosomal protein L32 [Deltaproteobacteria bacterium]|nr:50S ribosomal protein L32 [Deltaproteobacteria bacterium]